MDYSPAPSKNDRPERIGVLGGSFDPIHVGHLLLAETCLDEGTLDQVRLIPAATPPHKQDKTPTPSESRLAMVELAVAGHPKIVLDDREIARGGISYTVDTLESLRGEFPDAELLLIVGADMLFDLPNWRRAADILRLASPLVAQRPGQRQVDFSCLEAIAPPEAIARWEAKNIVAMPLVDLRATDIRQCARCGRSIRYRVPRAVEKFIQTHSLYASETSSIEAARTGGDERDAR